MNYGLIRAVHSEHYSTQHILFLVLNMYVNPCTKNSKNSEGFVINLLKRLVNEYIHFNF
jgi:hypothetical protein